MKRRQALAVAWGAVTWPWVASARAQAPQRGTLRRAGVLAPSTAQREALTLKPLFDEMQRLGCVEGQTVVFDRAFALDQY
jgi:hypothetical protein